MRKLLLGILIASALGGVSAAQARDTRYDLAIDDVLQQPDYRLKLGDDVAFFFGVQEVPAPVQSYGEYVSNRKTNSFGKPDEVACHWAFLSALLELRKRTEELGGNAVINIVSDYKKDVNSSDTTYECHAGGFVAGVALRGMIVKLDK